MPTLSSKHTFTNFPATAAAFLFLLFAIEVSTVVASSHHVINFRSPNLFPEGLAWDPRAQHFLVGSLRHRTISAVSDAGVVETLISDPSLPENVTILGLAVDSHNHRVLAAIHAMEPLPPFNALAAYDLRSRQRLFLSPLPSDAGDTKRATANDVSVDSNGDAYVTNSIGNYIWKVNPKGEASIFSNSRKFSGHTIPDTFYSVCGLNGVVYNNKGYLLVVQSNTGKMYKVDAEDGTVRQVLLNEDLMGADGVALRSDGVVLVVSFNKLWFVKSNDGWAQGAVFDKIDLDEEGFPTSVEVGERDRTYVLHGRVREGVLGNSEREGFVIEEVRSPKESETENIWIYVMVGFALAYFLFWRFQMKQLVTNMDKKVN